MYLPFLLKVRDVIDECRDRGVSYWAISGRRSHEEQAALYAIGRNGDTRRPVTDAKPGYSAHQFGIAVDLCRDAHVDRAGLQPDWDNVSYNMLGEVAERNGLQWGGRYARFDGGHIQMPVDLEPLSEAYQNGGLVSCFTYLDKLGAQRGLREI